MKVVTFGEIMARLAPEGFLRFRQAMPGKLNVTFAGAEANVAVSIALLGGESAFVTALPKNALAESCVTNLKSLGVDTQHILHADIGRLGLYFVETGANQRPSRVIYDRAHSSVSQVQADQYPWEAIFKNRTWFHTTGITPSLSKIASDTTLSAVQKAKSAGLKVSCDLNFRKKLWRWDDSLKPRELAEKTMRAILPFVDILIANEEDAADVLGIHAQDTDVHSGKLAIDKYPQVAREIVNQFSNISTVAITLRESISASHNNWGAMLYDAKSDQAFFAPVQNGEYNPYQIRNIVDRVGGGDAFGAGLIFALQTPELSACLAQSISGDFNYNSREEVEALMKGSISGRVVR
jgi:2-dehydro-3-deoxygluconokinase